MRSAIDYLVVGFGRNDFDGGILESLEKPIEDGVISVLGFAVVSKDEEGRIQRLTAKDVGDEMLITFSEKHLDENLVDEDDVMEIGELLEPGTAAGLIFIEHLWALPFKKALLAKEGVLLAEGRIHPDAAMELE